MPDLLWAARAVLGVGVGCGDRRGRSDGADSDADCRDAADAARVKGVCESAIIPLMYFIHLFFIWHLALADRVVLVEYSAE